MQNITSKGSMRYVTIVMCRVLSKYLFFRKYPYSHTTIITSKVTLSVSLARLSRKTVLDGFQYRDRLNL